MKGKCEKLENDCEYSHQSINYPCRKNVLFSNCPGKCGHTHDERKILISKNLMNAWLDDNYDYIKNSLQNYKNIKLRKQITQFIANREGPGIAE